MIETVESTFKYTQSEYVKAERQYLFASKTITKTSIVVLSLYLPFSILFFFLSSFGPFSILVLAVALVTGAVGCTVYFYMPAYRFKQTAKYQEEYHLTFSQDGIKFITPTINSELKWDIYAALWESDDFYFLIQASRLYSIIPKRGFLNRNAMHNFEEIALANFKSPKRMI